MKILALFLINCGRFKKSRLVYNKFCLLLPNLNFSKQTFFEGKICLEKKERKKVFKHLLNIKKNRNADQRLEPTLHRSHNQQKLDLFTAPHELVL